MRFGPGIFLLLSALVLAGCAKHEPVAEIVRPVQLAEVKLGSAANDSVFAGEVKPRHEADLAFRIGGKIIARQVEVGTRVKKGQVLARIDAADVGLQTEAAKASMAAAEAEATFAQAEYERYQNLFREKFVSASALEQKRNVANANRARLDQARAQLSVTQNQAAYATLQAPDAGVITTVTAEPGQVVAAGQTVLKLAREDQREVAISVPEGRIGEIRGAPQLAVFLWANPQKLYPARVREIAPAVDAVTRTFAVRVSILQPDADLQWGMTANVGLRGEALASAALIPSASLYRKDGAPAVWVYDPQSHKVSLRPVQVTQYREDGVVVASGLNAGERIVAAGANKLQPGQVVRPYEGGVGAAGPAPAPASAPAPVTATKS
jgi:multidrug efflux system membrane fusion protein